MLKFPTYVHDFPTRARLLRQHLDLNQDEMAKRFGLTRSYYGELENAKRDPSDTLVKMLSLLEETSRPLRGREASVPEDPSVVAPIHPRSPAPRPPTREDCHDYLNQYLEEAEEIPGAVARAYVQLQLHLPMAELEKLKSMSPPPS